MTDYYEDPDIYEIVDVTDIGPRERFKIVETHRDGSETTMYIPAAAAPKFIEQLQEIMED